VKFTGRPAECAGREPDARNRAPVDHRHGVRDGKLDVAGLRTKSFPARSVSYPFNTATAAPASRFITATTASSKPARRSTPCALQGEGRDQPYAGYSARCSEVLSHACGRAGRSWARPSQSSATAIGPST
jgi:hypothetical protein